MKRKITVLAKKQSEKISITVNMELDGINKGGWDADQQRLKKIRFKDALYSLLSSHGFHYDEIKIK